MGLVRFVTTTGAGYSGIPSKDKDTLYFISDERRIYKGEVPYSGGIFTTVAEFPETGAVNTLYVNSATGEVRYYNGTSYQTVVPATGKSITGKGDDSLATTAAVAAYVTSQIGDLNGSVLKGRVDTLEGEMDTTQGQIATINGEGDGSIKKAASDAVASAKSYTDTVAAGKANTAHTHKMADVTGLSDALAGKANTKHTHTIADVTDLQTALNGKADATAIAAEKTRAEDAEHTNATAIANETTRAKEAEQANAKAIANETTRAKEAEQANAKAIDAEKTRAENAEQTLQDGIITNATKITKLENNLSFNVKDYGAIGDGSYSDNAFASCISAALKYVMQTNAIFSPKTFTTPWQANIVIPQGTYNFENDITINGTNMLLKTANTLVGLNIIGIGNPVLNFNNNGGIKVNGAFFSCKNLTIENATDAFNIGDSVSSPYIKINDIFIKNVNNGIIFPNGTYVSEIENVICMYAKTACFDFGTIGTTLTVNHCYALASENAYGYKLQSYVYTVIRNCACDDTNIGYYINCNSGNTSISLENCGVEEVIKYPIQVIHMSYNSNIFIKNMTMVANHTYPTALIYTENNFKEMVIDGLTYISNNTDKALLIAGSTLVPPSFNNVSFRNIKNNQPIKDENKHWFYGSPVIYFNNNINHSENFDVNISQKATNINLHFTVIASITDTEQYTNVTNYIGTPNITANDITVHYDSTTNSITFNIPNVDLTDVNGYIKFNTYTLNCATTYDHV